MSARRAGFRSVFLLVLASALWLGASFPTDDAGRPAPWCSYVDDSVTPAVSVVCSVTRPLPASSSGVTSIATDTLGYGRTFFFSPSGSTGGANGSSAAIFVDEVNVVAFSYGDLFPSGNLRVATSTDGGRTWNGLTALGCPFGGACQGILQKVVRTVASTPTYLMAGGANVVPAQIFRSPSPTGGFTSVGVTGLSGVSRNDPSLAIQGAVVMAYGNSAAGVATACRSDDAGATFQPCVTVSPGVASGSVATPAANIWLASDTNGEVWRSTDNGASWAQVLATAGGPGDFTCLSGTVCLWTNTVTVFRSTDAGATWTNPVGAPANGARFCNYTSTVVDVIAPSGANFPQTATTTTTPAFRSTDGGVSWVQVPVTGGLAAFLNAPAISHCVTNTTGRAVFFAHRSADDVTAAYYGPTSANTVQIVGSNGIPLNVDGNGNFTGNQGLPQAIAGNGWPMSPVQGASLFNSTTTGAANAAVTVTIAAVTSQRVHLREVEAFCSAGTSTLTVTDGATLRYTTAANAVPAIGAAGASFRKPWAPAFDSTTGNALTVTLATCGVGNTGTLNVHADQGG